MASPSKIPTVLVGVAVATAVGIVAVAFLPPAGGGAPAAVPLAASASASPGAAASAAAPKLRRFEGHEGAVHHLAFSSDGATLSSSSDDTGDALARVWDMTSGAIVRRVGSADLEHGFFSADGVTYAGLEKGDVVRTWDVATGAATARFEAAGLVAAAPVAGSSKLVSAFANGTVALLVADGKAPAVLTKVKGRPLAVRVSGDGQRAVVSTNRELTVIELATARTTCVLPTETPVSRISLRRDGRFAATGGDEARIWDLDGCRLVGSAGQAHDGVVRAVHLSSNGQWLAAAAGRRVFLATVDDGGRTHIVHHHPVANGIVLSVAVTGDGKTVAEGRSDHAIEIWRPIATAP